MIATSTCWILGFGGLRFFERRSLRSAAAALAATGSDARPVRSARREGWFIGDNPKPYPRAKTSGYAERSRGSNGAGSRLARTSPPSSPRVTWHYRSEDVPVGEER